MEYNSVYFNLTEEQFEKEVCSGDINKIKLIAMERMFKMVDLPINVRIYEKEFIDKASIDLDGHSKFDFIQSFNIKKNFKRIMIASKNVNSKPSMISMKFETYDYRY